MEAVVSIVEFYSPNLTIDLPNSMKQEYSQLEGYSGA
jgi:hypothetical protein